MLIFAETKTHQVEGKEVPGPLFDFGLLMYHCGRTLLEHESGPFFYLSKVNSNTQTQTDFFTVFYFNKREHLKLNVV